MNLRHSLVCVGFFFIVVLIVKVVFSVPSTTNNIPLTATEQTTSLQEKELMNKWHNQSLEKIDKITNINDFQKVKQEIPQGLLEKAYSKVINVASEQKDLKSLFDDYYTPYNLKIIALKKLVMTYDNPRFLEHDLMRKIERDYEYELRLQKNIISEFLVITIERTIELTPFSDKSGLNYILYMIDRYLSSEKELRIKCLQKMTQQ